MRNLYLLLAVIGALVPLGFFAAFFVDNGVSVPPFLRGTFANYAASGFVADLFISSFVFWIYMFQRQQGPKPWLFILLNLSIGLSCALPAYLYASTAKD
ncbi:MAG: DUF2834 domain-containing protein [Pseudomonadales bacterium]